VAVAEVEMQRFAKREATLFKKEIKDQAFQSFKDHPLAPITLQRKLLHKLDLRTMIATGHYVASIGVFREEGIGGLVTYRVGFSPLMHAKDEDGRFVPITLDELARIHEYGSATKKIPARPHWRPHLQDMQARATLLGSVIQRAVMRTARRRQA
jgi:hypothetical protein